MHWIDFYNNEYCIEFDKFNELRKNSNNKNMLCQKYTNIVSISCKLIKYYIHYQGLFLFDDREVIRKAFYTGLIKDGEKWINAVTLLKAYNYSKQAEVENLIILYCNDENCKIFEDLKNTFKSLSEAYIANS